MKTIKWTMLLLSFLITNSCCPHDPVNYNYFLFVRFLDASENDLVKGIECTPDEDVPSDFDKVKTDLYTLGIVFSDQDQCADDYYFPPHQPGVIYEKHVPLLYIHTFDDGYYYLCFNVFTYHDCNCPGPVKRFTHKLKCPYIFGDDLEHEMITYWRKGRFNPGCYRIELDGKEYNEITFQDYSYYDQMSVATVILDSHRKIFKPKKRSKLPL